MLKSIRQMGAACLAFFLIPVHAYGQFSDSTGASFSQLARSSAAWGDYDNDGDLDLLLIGCGKLKDKSSDTDNSSNIDCDEGSFSTELYQNFGTDVFNPAPNVSFKSIADGDIAWGDYDGDGDLDILMAGRDNTFASVSLIYKNNGNGGFQEIDAGLTGVRFSAVGWVDFDNDGDLDAMLSGRNNESTGDTLSTLLYRNDGDNVFSLINTPFPGLTESNFAWGDFDNDGDLDVFLMGNSGEAFDTNRHNLYTNDGNGDFSPALFAPDFPRGAHDGSVSWGDFDNDDDLDLLVTGKQGSNNWFGRIYENDARNFSLFFDLPDFDSGVATWGDYNNDGDLDVAVAGSSAGEPLVRIFENVDNTFIEIEESYAGIIDGDLAWGNYDGGSFDELDKDLDLLVTGNAEGLTPLTLILKNGSPASTNPPPPPEIVSFNYVDGDSNSVKLKWNAAGDGLSYNIRIRPDQPVNDIVSSMTDDDTGWRRLPGLGNVNQNTSWTLKNLNANRYHWSVQSIDQAFRGSPFSEEGTFDIPGPDVTPIILDMSPAHRGRVNVRAIASDPIGIIDDVFITWSLNDQPMEAIPMCPDTLVSTFIGAIPYSEEVCKDEDPPDPPVTLSGGDRVVYNVVATNLSQGKDSTLNDTFIVRPAAPEFNGPFIQKDDQAIELYWNLSASDTSIATVYLHRGTTLQEIEEWTSWQSRTENTLVDELSPDLTYFFRLQTENAGGLSEFSDTLDVSLCFRAAPEITTINGPNRIVVSWQNDAQCPITGYELIRNGIPVDSLPPYSISYIDNNVSSSESYRYRVRAFTERVERSSSESLPASPFDYPLSHFLNAAPVTFGDYTLPESYRLVGLPGHSNIKLADTFAADDILYHDWNAHYEQGNSSSDPEDSRVRYSSSSSDLFTFKPGVGFWIIRNKAWQIPQEEVDPVQLAEDNSFAIDVHDGWNIISSPFIDSVAWADIKILNNMSQTLHRFERGYKAAEYLKAYEGFYYYHLSSTSRSDSTLLIPYPYSNSSAKTAPPPTNNRPALTLTARNDAELEAGVQIGFHSEASNALDNFDQFAPPGAFEAVSLKLFNGTLDTPYKWLHSEFRPQSEENQEFELLLNARKNDSITLETTGMDQVEMQEILLIDNSSGRTMDLRDQPVVRFSMDGEVKLLTLLIGSATFVEEQKALLAPAAFQLSQSFPNPFTDEVTFSFGIPKTQDRVHVTIEVFNMLGQKVAEVVNREYQAGFHQARWNGSDANGNPMPSGVYIYRIGAGGWQSSKLLARVK